MKPNYEYRQCNAKLEYHAKMEVIIDCMLNNEFDPVGRKRLMARRTHHRRLWRKYEAKCYALNLKMEAGSNE